jgi:hypothetical protein
MQFACSELDRMVWTVGRVYQWRKDIMYSIWMKTQGPIPSFSHIYFNPSTVYSGLLVGFDSCFKCSFQTHSLGTVALDGVLD